MGDKKVSEELDHIVNDVYFFKRPPFLNVKPNELNGGFDVHKSGLSIGGNPNNGNFMVDAFSHLYMKGYVIGALRYVARK